LRFAKSDSKEIEAPCDVSYPPSVSLLAYEESAEQAEGKPSTLLATDDPNQIGFRTNSKVGIYVTVTPRSERVRFSLLVHMEVRPGKAALALPIDVFSYQLVVDLGSCP